MRTVVRSTLLAGLTGSLMISAAWAGIGLAPVPTSSTPIDVPGTPAAVAAGTESTGAPVNPVTLGAGQLLVGAAKTSMNPRPEDFPGAVWERDPAKCQTLAPAWFQDLPKAAVNALDGIANPGSVWPENPNCIYQGGFGLGPMNPVKAFDQEFGLWVRSMAFSDGKQTLVTTVIDGEGWLWDYKSKCTDCGAKQIAAALAADPELAAKGVTAASHVLHATHSHASPDFIGGWGFVPNWYMKQITDTIKATAKQAVLQMEAATLETGEAEARAHNSERRGTYHSPEESSISWLRAVAVAQQAADPAPTATATATIAPGPGHGDEAPGQVKKQPTPSPTATGTAAPPAPPRVIATLGAYAAHPVTYGNNGGVAHPDWPGLFNQSLETRFGGIGLHFQTGLGNMTGANRLTGKALVDLLPAVGAGRPVHDTTVKVDQVLTRSALTNVPLSALGTPGLFDRKFDPRPVAVAVSDSDADAADQESLQRDGASLQKGQAPETAPCISASAQSVELPATAARIGNDIIFTAAPGEVFANYTNTVKEKNAGRISFPLAQANDALGYMPQSFEINQVGQQGLGFAAGGFLFINYEDSYAIDKCTGDLLLEKTLDLLTTVKAP